MVHKDHAKPLENKGHKGTWKEYFKELEQREKIKNIDQYQENLGQNCEGLAPCEQAKCKAKQKKENMVGQNCEGLAPDEKAKCEAKKKKENMPGSDCASLPPEDQKDCYAKKCPILKKHCSEDLAKAFGIDLAKKDKPKPDGKAHFFAKSDPNDCLKETIIVPCIADQNARRLVAVILFRDNNKPVLHFEGTEAELKKFLEQHPCYCSGAIRYL